MGLYTTNQINSIRKFRLIKAHLIKVRSSDICKEYKSCSEMLKMNHFFKTLVAGIVNLVYLYKFVEEH